MPEVHFNGDNTGFHKNYNDKINHLNIGKGSMVWE